MKALKSLAIVLFALSCLGLLGPDQTVLQAAMVDPTAPSRQNQRQALQRVQSQLDGMANATRSADIFRTEPDAVLYNHFEGLVASYENFKTTLAAGQWQRAGNDLADLDAGLSVIAETFANYQEDLHNGRHPTVALRTLCQVLRDATRLWGQQLSTVARRYQVGR